MSTHVTLLEELKRYEPADAQDTAAKERIVGHVEAGGLLFDRTRWDGHLTGSAFVIDASAQHVLLLFHRKLERWLQPGGHGESGEIHPLDVARREAEEETGIPGLTLHEAAPQPFDLDVHTIPARQAEQRHEHLDVRYLFVAPAGAEPRPDLAEVVGFRWVAFAEAGAPGADPSVARAVTKIARLTAAHAFPT